MKPKKNRKIIRMIIISLLVNGALVFCIARLAFQFEIANNPGKTDPDAAVYQSPTSAGQRSDVSGEHLEEPAKSPVTWLIPHSVIEEKPVNLPFR